MIAGTVSGRFPMIEDMMVGDGGLRMAVVEITPTIATEWLKLNTGNFRKRNPDRITLYMKEVLSGNWELNGSAIKFGFNEAGDEILVDGQHRLEAVVKSGKSIMSLVIWGVSELSPQDDGMPRTMAQRLSKAGFPQSSTVSSTARAIIAYQYGKWGDSVWPVGTMTNSEILSFAVDNRERLLNAVRVARKCSGMPQSTVAVLAYIGSGDGLASENRTVQWFVEGLVRGTDLTECDAVLHLRNRLLSTKGTNTLSPYMKRVLATLAWNKTVNGEPCKHLRFTATGPTRQSAPKEILVADPN